MSEYKYTISAIGQDSHRFTNEDKPLVLGGVVFDGCDGMLANSDGDVVLHAITNAISGLTAQNILGAPADELCKKGITDSTAYLNLALVGLKEKKMKLVHASVSVECKKPKISPRVSQMRESIGKLLGISPEEVGITATTGEELTAFGRGEGIAVICIVTAIKE
ncbi:MAG: 2-C-methyl-D-erythritol 2,4-cyclodiphosphate synthase [Ruminococcaceae bacterium]|nr:2-C-methyl-D-erythritol 2,4-cyclodiphosphate synthase [Oscillospiraceae bacterium]